MNDQLKSISKLFSENLFRIPDFQRGYAWSKKEIEEFWNDLMRLKPGRNHYVGVLTLEQVNSNKYNTWLDDLWIINSKRYNPFYIVDGQQRLTTSIILISAIVEVMINKKIDKLNFTSRDKIIERFLFEEKDETSNKTFLFCYEKDNPSYSFLISRIFNQLDIVTTEENTTYNNNLLNAKQFFLSRLQGLSLEELEMVYTKITQHFLFNTYEISEDIDVYVSFETMNNRGKRLTRLELLKNRLIYISSLFTNDSSEVQRLREKINTCWKNVYHYLGLNKDNPLIDDEFLDAHFHLYFAKKLYEKYKTREDRRYMFEYYDFESRNFLLNRYFIPEKVETNELQIKTMFDYLEDFNKCIQIWSNIHNPIFANMSDDIKELLRKINFLLESEENHYQSDYYRTSFTKLLVYSVISKEISSDVKKFLKVIERYMFIKNFYPYEVFYSEKEKITLEELFYKYQTNDIQFDDVVNKIDNYISLIISNQTATQKMLNFYNRGGFYNKKATPYILWEYENKLQKDSNNKIQKIPDFNTAQEVFNSIEHIYPKSPSSEYWKSRFKFGRGNIKYRNSLGNLLMLSQSKNEKLSNKPFNEKCCNKDNNLGYKFGSYSEMEVSTESEWTPKEILNRGIKMIHFINERWDLNIKKTDYKKFLGLDKKEEV